MSNNKDVKLTDIMEELNEVLFEHFEDKGELDLRVTTNSYSDRLHFSVELIDTENYDLYDDVKEDFTDNVQDMKSAKHKVFIELLEKFKNIEESSKVIREHIENILKMFKSNNYVVGYDHGNDKDKSKTVIYDKLKNEFLVTDLELPNEFDNKRFE